MHGGNNTRRGCRARELPAGQVSDGQRCSFMPRGRRVSGVSAWRTGGAGEPAEPVTVCSSPYLYTHQRRSSPVGKVSRRSCWDFRGLSCDASDSFTHGFCILNGRNTPMKTRLVFSVALENSVVVVGDRYVRGYGPVDAAPSRSIVADERGCVGE